MKIDITVFDGFDEIDAIVPLEVFRMAAARGADVEANLVTFDDSQLVTGINGLTIQPDGIYTGDSDILVLVGGGWLSGSNTGIREQIQRGAIVEAVKQHHDLGKLLVSVCTGAMALHAAGVLAGRSAITHRQAIGDLANSGINVVEARVVDDGDIVTCGGVTAATNLALHLARRLWGDDMHEHLLTGLDHISVGHTHYGPNAEPLR